jgi:4-hydroxybenzoate polyprenyltransferase
LDRKSFDDTVKILSTKLNNLKIMDTICDSTRLRQDDVISAIDDNIDTLIVVGGKNSANTKRLAKIGIEKNIKTYHIETENEINEENLLNSKYVLVTAGASTPGWIINNILEKLYNIKFHKSNIFLNAFKNILEFVVRTNLLSAFAGFFMSSIALKYNHFEMSIKFPIISFLYLYSMYSINNYFDKEFLKISNSYKHRVYKKYGLFLLGISILFIIISIYISFYISRNVTIVLLLSYLLGISYSTNIIKNIIKKINFNSITKIYHSKILAILGWIIIINILPLVYYGKGISTSIPFIIFVLTIIFQRHFLTDLIAYQGDFIFGRKTIPIIFGDKRNLILYILSISSIIIFGISTIFLKNYIDLFLIINILYYIILLYNINKHRYLISLKYEIIVDLNFLIIILYSIFRYYF